MAGARLHVISLCLWTFNLAVICNSLPKIQFPKVATAEGGSCSSSLITKGQCTRLEECDKAFLHYFTYEDHQSVCQDNAFYKVRCCTSFLEYCQDHEHEHIFNGTEAESSMFPYLARIGLINDESKLEWLCSASIISERFLLTAAHCKQRHGVPLTHVGLACSDTTEECENILIIKNFIPHHQYNGTVKHHDIALLELQEVIKFNVRVRPICPFRDTIDVPPSENLTIVGWGDTQRIVATPRLMQATVTTVQLPECRELNEMMSERSGVKFLPNGIADTMYCARGAEGDDGYVDACARDSGGPLVLVKKKNPYLVGVISTGYGCGSEHPGLYTRVGSYFDWIKEKVR